jgi:hypothetical protein
MLFKTTVWIKKCSPKASQNISKLSAADLPSFMQDVLGTPFSIFATLHKQKETQS